MIIDVQVGLDDPAQGERNNPSAERNIAALLAAWRRHERPIVHVQHDSVEAESKLRPELPGNAIKPEARPLPGETVIRKRTNSAFVDTGLEQLLRSRGIEQLVVAGLTTDHCVSATVRSAADLGFDVTLVRDACAAFGRTGFDGRFYSGDEIHRNNLVSLDGEFCRLRGSDELLAELW
ncbi:MAG: cysteine hydrolase family protein [Gammaproteobacteria bacterium]|nr:cysteine hydrolase family protein [Gammaproteobacteria bacterium]